LKNTEEGDKNLENLKMVNMMPSNFNIDLPPYVYLTQVLNHCPRSASTYIELWRHKDKNSKVSVAKNQIRNQFLMSAAKFRNDLMSLVKEGLINVDEQMDSDERDWWKLNIELVNFEDE
jgi:hypothetical protein